MKIVVLVTLSASICMAAPGSELPALPDTVVIREWLVSGPFSVGVREGITGVVEDPAELRPIEGETLRSALVQGGVVTWRRLQADSLGWLETAYDSVRWDTIQEYWGIAGLMSAGFACAEFEVSFACRALAVAAKLGGFTLNGRGYLGDVYGNGWFHVPVVLDSGTNRVVLRLSGYGDQRVRFALLPASEPLVPIVADATVPDLIADSTQTLWLGVPLLNTTTSRLDSMRLSFLLGDSALADTMLSGLTPLCISKPALRVPFPALSSDTQPVLLCMVTRWRDFSRTDTIRLRIRNQLQPHKVTFISKLDSSCQYYAVLYPKDYDPAKRYGLILSLHGAGVEASGLAECFRPKDWAFVVCPTNRRPFGFDWQDWGRLDALEVLDRTLAELPVDPDRVTLTGHSMGGHGTWHVGLAHADRFAAAAPAAGWPVLQLYVPTFLQRSAILADPAKLALRDMTLRPDNTPAMLANAMNLPLFILHGGDDDNVPPVHGRAFAGWLDELGYQYRYK
ncbi:MAG: prolyl oligopeptidase family serine peptidase, partial [candidate division WOR-3 bacterium]